ELIEVKLTAVDPDTKHEVLVLQLLRRQRGGTAAVDPGPALGVQPEPAEPHPQVLRIDAAEPLPGVDPFDPFPDPQRIVVLFGAFGGVEGFPVARRPLALATRAADGLVDRHLSSFAYRDAYPRTTAVSRTDGRRARPERETSGSDQNGQMALRSAERRVG